MSDKIPRHANEAERLHALHSYGILDTPTEPAFDDITRIASYVCGTPIAVINFIETERQWFKSEVGIGAREMPIELSICAYTLLEQSFLEIGDLKTDRRFDSNPLVQGDGTLRFYAGALLRTSDGLPIGTMCVLDTKPRELSVEQRDVLTALARQVMSQLELRRALVIADRLQRNVAHLMAVAGHDLKQPLQVMVMAIDRVRKDLRDPRDQQRMAQAIEAGMRMAKELDRLAEASEIPAAGAPRPTAFAVNEVLNPVQSIWQSHAEARGLDLRVLFSTARIVSDPEMLRAILGNLVGNAIKYTREGRVLIGCRRRGNQLSIDVMDTGEGITANAIETIFDAFRQINPRSEGLGLGLSIVRRTAEALGHSVEVTSKPGRGTRFRVWVPLAAN